MDPGRRQSQMLAAKNSKLYMDLKDIIRENALCFLPAKSLLKCRGVCRDWKLLIASPFFVHNQSNSFRRISGLFSQTPGNPPSFISIDTKSCGVPDPSLKFLPVPVDIRSSSNGLLCCQGQTGDRAYYICNPVTRQYKILPKPNSDHGPDPALVLVFEPSLLSFVAEYKLVCAFPSTDFDDATEFEIYSSKEGSWKSSAEISFASKRKPVPRTGVYVNGVVYWQATVGGVFGLDLMKDKLISVQGGGYCYYPGSSKQVSLGIMNGKICAARSTGSQVSINFFQGVYSKGKGKNQGDYNFCLDEALGGAGYDDHASVYFFGDGVVMGHSGRVMYSLDVNKKEAITLSTSPPEYNAWVVPYVNTLVEL